jgi:hypothetical protein
MFDSTAQVSSSAMIGGPNFLQGLIVDAGWSCRSPVTSIQRRGGPLRGFQGLLFAAPGADPSAINVIVE